MRGIWAAFLAAFAVAACQTTPGLTDGRGGYDGFHKSLTDTAWGVRFSAPGEPVRRGTRAVRFEVRAGDCGADPGWSDCDADRERAELSARPWLAPEGTYWFAWSVFLPADFPDSRPVDVTLGQVHQRGGPSGTAGGFASFPPLMQFDLRDGVYVAKWHRLSGDPDDIRDETVARPLKPLPAMRGGWTDILMRLDLDPEIGSVRVWVDGTEVAPFENPPIRFRPDSLYFKFGLYRSFVSRLGRPMPTQIAYFDEVRLGRARGAVDWRANPDLPPVD